MTDHYSTVVGDPSVIVARNGLSSRGKLEAMHGKFSEEDRTLGQSRDSNLIKEALAGRPRNERVVTKRRVENFERFIEDACHRTVEKAQQAIRSIFLGARLVHT